MNLQRTSGGVEDRRSEEIFGGREQHLCFSTACPCRLLRVRRVEQNNHTLTYLSPYSNLTTRIRED